jgi:uncharacterized protein YjgD (DUF1641 family)
MANPIAFKPLPIDPHLELERRLQAAPREHAEALLVAYDVLQAAHDAGVLDTVHGLIGAKDTLIGKLAEYARLPEGTNGIRNLLAAAKLVTLLDPDLLDRVYQSVQSAAQEHAGEHKAPSLFEITRRFTSEDSRRALSLLSLTLGSLGKALGK